MTNLDLENIFDNQYSGFLLLTIITFLLSFKGHLLSCSVVCVHEAQAGWSAASACWGMHCHYFYACWDPTQSSKNTSQLSSNSYFSGLQLIFFLRKKGLTLMQYF